MFILHVYYGYTWVFLQQSGTIVELQLKHLVLRQCKEIMCEHFFEKSLEQSYIMKVRI